MKFFPILLSFFLFVMVPQPLVNPLVEILEEHHSTLLERKDHAPLVNLRLIQIIHDFPDHLQLTPQASPDTELRPPARLHS